VFPGLPYAICRISPKSMISRDRAEQSREPASGHGKRNGHGDAEQEVVGFGTTRAVREKTENASGNSRSVWWPGAVARRTALLSF